MLSVDAGSGAVDLVGGDSVNGGGEMAMYSARHTIIGWLSLHTVQLCVTGKWAMVAQWGQI